MPSVQSADQFIERSLLLLQSSPATTRVSITYGSLSKKAGKDKDASKVRKSRSSADSFVSFKVYDPLSGTLYKLTTHKAKELSRVLTALGPHGVQVSKKTVKSKENKKSQTITEDADGDVNVDAGTETEKHQQQQQDTINVQVRGFSSVLANADIEEDVTEQVKEESKAAEGAKKDAAKKGKKKKGKR